MSDGGGGFPLDVDPDQVDLAATRLRALAGDLESERAGVAAPPPPGPTAGRAPPPPP